jgi:DNA (cytosine-5)-methyltransferase 1
MPESPPILVAENVIGLVSAQEGQHYRALHNALINRGYRVGSVVLDAQHWVPQSRPRVFVIATRGDVVIPPSLQTTKPTWAHPKAVERAAKGLDGWIWWNLPRPSLRKQGLSDIIEWDAPFADAETDRRNISLISSRHRDRLDCVPETSVFVAPGYRRTRNGKQVLELRFDDLAGCLRTPEGGSSRQVVVIKKDGRLHSRLITTREAARLMGAPDTYLLPGRYNDGYKAMGDAVAVPVAKWLAEYLLVPLVKSYDDI